MDIRQVDFRVATLRPADRPPEWCPHVAVAGRSNVGKSSLLNWFLKRNVARVAKAPGKTRTLNFFHVNRAFYLVDLPGYGFAKVGKALRDEWGREIGRYLTGERRLAGVMALIDVRHGPTRLDLDLQDLLLAAELERIVVLTKADKVGRGHRARTRDAVQRQLGLASPPVVVSVHSGEGRRELVAAVDTVLKLWHDRNSGETHGTQEEKQQ